MRDWTLSKALKGESIALVPTMGALHPGHLALVEKAAQSADRVVVSIFVNPTQFGPSEDFGAYPRNLDEDLAKLAKQGLTNVVFAPDVKQIYPYEDNFSWVEVAHMGDHLCGASREGHFRGVTTVVSRLFAVVRPNYAVFGLKDAQQFFILRRMTREMGFDTQLVGVETVRDEDGLALSSRNRYLTPHEREQATVLSRSVALARDLIEHQGERNALSIISSMESIIGEASEGRQDYVSIVDTQDLQPVASLEAGQTVLAAVAVYFGKARLIDNAIVEVK
jgi:pantoate--beta-alanine ligase